jgi:hypothetical protein
LGLFINCKENSRLVTESWDRPLSVREWLTMRIHLHVCENCVRFVRQMNLIREWLHKDDQSEGLSSKAKSRIQSKLDESGQT